MKRKRKVRKRIDPYRQVQARQRRAANVARQESLRKAGLDLGHPVHSRPTPFIESLHPNAPLAELKTSYLNYFVKPNELSSSIERSAALTKPREIDGDDSANADRLEIFEAQHENAVKAMNLITDLGNSSQKDRTRVNVMRCIEEFGRHRTDEILPAKPRSSQHPLNEGSSEVIPARAGPDTGSSEVQVAILTAKINVLAANLGGQDKINKRNLRLLVHKRQKHLNYLRKQDRGGPRWRNLVEKLGVNDGMWRGEISL
jgi:ribosomal protein S15